MSNYHESPSDSDNKRNYNSYHEQNADWPSMDSLIIIDKRLTDYDYPDCVVNDSGSANILFNEANHIDPIWQTTTAVAIHILLIVMILFHREFCLGYEQSQIHS